MSIFRMMPQASDTSSSQIAWNREIFWDSNGPWFEAMGLASGVNAAMVYSMENPKERMMTGECPYDETTKRKPTVRKREKILSSLHEINIDMEWHGQTPAFISVMISRSHRMLSMTDVLKDNHCIINHVSTQVHSSSSQDSLQRAPVESQKIWNQTWPYPVCIGRKSCSKPYRVAYVACRNYRDQYTHTTVSNWKIWTHQVADFP